jgi:RNA polymerase sigma factor (sigma-70 family)
VCFDVGVVDDVARDERRVDFERVYRRELAPIVALAVALTGSRETGVELAQEAMLRAFREWSRVEQLERPGAWIRRVVINLAHDARRRGVREQRALHRLDASEVADRALPDDEFWAAVRELPERQRTVVALRYVEDLPVAAIASLMEVSEGTVKTLLFRARRTLARTMGVEEVNDGDDR